MNEKRYLARISVSPDVMAGQPAIKGKKITVKQILKALASGLTVEELLEDYPGLEYDDINAALLYTVR
jgi:uncharacterized protein (DUF433 family)